MAKLEDIPKKQIFRVPENYFEQLPAQIQSRMANTRADRRLRPFFRIAIRYAVPVLVAAAVLFYFREPTPNAASILTTVDTEDLIMYIHESEITTEDLLENVELNDTELEAIENEVYNDDLLNVDPETIESELNTI